jgi:hypothetical protein
MQANLARCVGVGCKLSWAVMALGIVLKYVYTLRLGVPDVLYRVSSADTIVACWRLTLRSFVSWTTAGDAIPLMAWAPMPLTAMVLNQSLTSVWTGMRRARRKCYGDNTIEARDSTSVLGRWAKIRTAVPSERRRDTGRWQERYGHGLDLYTNMDSRCIVRMRNVAAASSSHQ